MPKLVIVDRASLEERRRRMIDYLDLKRHEQDWHAVWDAAVDLETIDARLHLLFAQDEAQTRERQKST